MLPIKLDALAKIKSVYISHNPLMKLIGVVASDNLIDPIGICLNRAELRSQKRNVDLSCLFSSDVLDK